MVAHAGGEELHSEVEEDLYAVVEEQEHPKGHNSIPRRHIFQRCRIFQCRMLRSENPEIASPSPSKIFRSDIASEYPCYRALF